MTATAGIKGVHHAGLQVTEWMQLFCTSIFIIYCDHLVSYIVVLGAKGQQNDGIAAR